MWAEAKNRRTIWQDTLGQPSAVHIIDQRALPFHFRQCTLDNSAAAVAAIAKMKVRGAPLIGVTAAYGMALAMREDPSDNNLEHAYTALLNTRPTAVDLRWALETMRKGIKEHVLQERSAFAFALAADLAENNVRICKTMGDHGASLLQRCWRKKRKNAPQSAVLNILTHCNAGWLAAVDWGSALAPVYKAHRLGIPLHIWVDETRPRNQGARLTAWELGQEGIPHTVIVDNAGGHLMQHHEVDICLVGGDRATRTGDVANKIGTYLKALAAYDNSIPFYAVLPSSTIDWNIHDGVQEIPIEERSAEEVECVRTANGPERVVAPGSAVHNPGFDVTPARLITGIISERGICAASPTGLRDLYPEHFPQEHHRA